jgi:ATP-binding cassette subfamily B protein
MFATMSTSMVYWFGGWRAITGGMTVGTIVSFGVLAQRAYTPVNSLTNVRIDLATALVSFERVFEVLEFPNPIVDAPDAVDLVDPKGRVELDHVAYAYPLPHEATLLSLENPSLAALGRRGKAPDDADETEAVASPDRIAVLQDVSFSAEPGETVAIVGPTGAGKSTTLNLVPRLADVSGGAILVDGVDVRRLTLRSLRRAIGVVSQDSHLFHDTLRNNLLYAKPDASEDELVRACTLARIHDLIAGLPEGYDTVAGERGYRMSGGEKQRLAIARMILKDPAIVILDEATAHLDSRNERLIQEALAESLRGRTTLVIAHRLSTIVNADRVVVIDRGRVVQVGSHAELVAEPGLYRDLYETQFTVADGVA